MINALDSVVLRKWCSRQLNILGKFDLDVRLGADFDHLNLGGTLLTYGVPQHDVIHTESFKR